MTNRFCSRARRSLGLGALLILLAFASSPALRAESPVPAESPSPTHTPSTAIVVPPALESALKAAFVDDATITGYLSDLITWYRRLISESQLVDHPEETLFFATDQQIGKEVLNLGFQAARAQAALNAMDNRAGSGKSVQASVLAGLETKAQEAQAALTQAQQRVKDLQAQLSSAPRSARAAIAAQIANARAEVDLAQGRADAINSMLQYAGGLWNANSKSAGIEAQIAQLQQTISETDKATKPSTGGAENKRLTPSEGGGIVELMSEYFALRSDGHALDDADARASDLAAKTNYFGAPAISLVQSINQRGAELAKVPASSDVTEIQARTREYQKLIALRDLAMTVEAPLAKQQVQLSLYHENLARWRSSLDRYSDRLIRELAIRLATLLGLLGLVIAGNFLWRHLIERYVPSEQRRRQLQQLGQPVFWALIALVLVVNFATELGPIATIMGFAAAGIALALQNVILSVAGYFFLIGKFGIRVGDRVQIGSTVGDVISLGLVKLTLMELSVVDRQPTGRVVVYSNAVVFQPNGNFFKQAPGMGFVWNEIRLTLAPDWDYRAAEKRLVDAVDEVFARYRDRAQRDFHYLEADLQMPFETPRPQSRLSLTSSGLEMVIRYPAEVRSATQIADEVSRRVLDAIKREPGLQLVSPSPANIQPLAQPEQKSADYSDGHAESPPQSAKPAE